MESPEALEHQLTDDLRSLGPPLENERFVRELYRALTRTRWKRFDRDGAVSLSFGRAEALLNELRAERGQEPLALAQTGGEGEVSEWMDDTVLTELGWSASELDTSRNDEAHLAQPEGEPRTEPQDSLAQGHREADERPPVPRQGTPGR
jgi:hypothetical protein